jgi:hypothetical protein
MPRARAITPTCAVQAGYFRLDDINAKLKEQLRKETERANELKEECDQLRRAGGGAGGSGPHHDGEIQQLRDQLRQAQRERDQAQRELAAGGGMGADPDVFEPTRSGTSGPVPTAACGGVCALKDILGVQTFACLFIASGMTRAASWVNSLCAQTALSSKSVKLLLRCERFVCSLQSSAHMFKQSRHSP